MAGKKLRISKLTLRKSVHSRGLFEGAAKEPLQVLDWSTDFSDPCLTSLIVAILQSKGRDQPDPPTGQNKDNEIGSTIVKKCVGPSKRSNASSIYWDAERHCYSELEQRGDHGQMV